MPLVLDFGTGSNGGNVADPGRRSRRGRVQLAALNNMTLTSITSCVEAGRTVSPSTDDGDLERTNLRKLLRRDNQ